jgi:hypothetical protein
LSESLNEKQVEIFVQFSLSFSAKMNVLAILIPLMCISAVTSHSVDDEWRSFKAKFNKSYDSPADEANKLKVFRENFEFIRKHNKNETAPYRLEMNREGDMTDDESVQMLEELETG